MYILYGIVIYLIIGFIFAEIMWRSQPPAEKFPKWDMAFKWLPILIFGM